MMRTMEMKKMKNKKVATEEVSLKIEDYFLLTWKAKTSQFSYNEHFTKKVYMILIERLKEFDNKRKVQQAVADKLSWMIACYNDDHHGKGYTDDSIAYDGSYVNGLTAEWERANVLAIGYGKVVKDIGKLLRNIKKTRNRLNSIAKVIVNIYNSSDEIKAKKFEEVAKDFKICMSKYKLLNNGRMIAIAS